MSKQIVVPGELVTSERKRMGQNVYLQEGKIYSNAVGFVSETDTVASVVPLNGVYLPQMGDFVIGIVAGEKFSVYDINLNSFYLAGASKRDLREPLQIHSFVSAKIQKVSEMNEVELGFVRTLFGGEVIDFNPVKIPRLIGRNGSMLEVLKKGTRTTFFVGKNGKIWAKGGNIELFKRALNMISEKSHEENLTNRITEFLDKENSANPIKAESFENAQSIENVENNENIDMQGE